MSLEKKYNTYKEVLKAEFSQKLYIYIYTST